MDPDRRKDLAAAAAAIATACARCGGARRWEGRRGLYRVDSSRNSNTGGTGLGLAIVKHVLLRHRARLEISSVLGHGSTFTCHFPPAQMTRSRVIGTDE